MKRHLFNDVKQLYDGSQCYEEIDDGDILEVPKLSIVAILIQAWPVHVNCKGDRSCVCGAELHTLCENVGWDNLDDGKYRASWQTAMLNTPLEIIDHRY